MCKMGSNTHYIRHQIQNNNTTLHYWADGDTVQRIAIRDVPILPYRASVTGLPAVFWYLLLGIGPQKILQSICG